MDLSYEIDLMAVVKIFWKAKKTEITDRNTGEKSTQNRLHWYAFGTYWIPVTRVEESRNSQYRGWVMDGSGLAPARASQDPRRTEVFTGRFGRAEAA